MGRTPLLILVLVGFVRGVAAQEAMTPAYFAVSVADLDASIQWYSRTLELTTTRLPARGPVRAAVLHGHGLIVELIEHPQAFDLADRLPELEDRYLGHGLFKVGFFVKDLDEAIARLRARGARFRGEAFADPVLEVRSILLLDNSGNVIQLLQRAPGK